MNISYVSNSNIFDFSFLFGLDYIFLTNDLMFRELSIFKKKYNLSIEIIRIDHERLSYADSFFSALVKRYLICMRSISRYLKIKFCH